MVGAPYLRYTSAPRHLPPAHDSALSSWLTHRSSVIGGYSYHFRQHNISRVYCSRVDPVPPAPLPRPAAALSRAGWRRGAHPRLRRRCRIVVFRVVQAGIIGACPERYLRIYLHTNIPWRSRVYGYRVFNKPTVSRPPADTYIPRAGCPDYTYHPKYPNPARPKSATLTVTIIHAWSGPVVDVQG